MYKAKIWFFIDISYLITDVTVKEFSVDCFKSQQLQAI